MLSDNILKSKNITILDKNSVYIDSTVTLKNNITIYPNNYIYGNSIIDNNVTLLPNNFIKDSTIKSGTKIFNSVIEESIVCENVSIGPFAHLRPNSIIDKEAKIGNFVEIKNSTIGEKTKVNHLSYVGDAFVGKETNIGCGVVFVNYTGKTKHKTFVGDKSFVGSSVNLIAPVKVGDKAYICAGTTIDKDVNDGSFVIGRSRMQEKLNYAKNYLKGD